MDVDEPTARYLLTLLSSFTRFQILNNLGDTQWNIRFAGS